MKNVLLPTDLTVQSLSPVHNIAKESGNNKVIIHVVHMLDVPTSITDLLFLKEPYDAIPATFSEAIQLLAYKYKDVVEKIQFEFMYCNSTRYLRNVIEAKGIETVYMLSNYTYLQTLPESARFVHYFDKCRVPVNKLSLHPDVSSAHQLLSSLLYRDEHLLPASSKEPKTLVAY